MNLIDTSYFRGDINIPGADRAEIAKVLEGFIAKYEPEFLYTALGRRLAKEFLVQMAVDPIPAIWTDLLQGADFEYPDGTDRRWEGFIISTAGPVTVLSELNKKTDLIKRSPIANYVYYEYMRYNSSQTATLGEVSGKAQNAAVVSPIRKMVNAWNEMTYQLQELWYFLRSKGTDVYEDWNDGEVFYKTQWQFKPINEFNI